MFAAIQQNVLVHLVTFIAAHWKIVDTVQWKIVFFVKNLIMFLKKFVK